MWYGEADEAWLRRKHHQTEECYQKGLSPVANPMLPQIHKVIPEGCWTLNGNEVGSQEIER